ncbi:MAG: PilZ domain-containing protein [bacterium]
MGSIPIPSSTLKEKIMEERRKFVRLQKPVEVKYKFASESSKDEETKTRDISEGGVRIMMNTKILPGNIIDLEIILPDTAEPIKALGETVWEEEFLEGRNLAYEIGVKFIKISPKDREKISKHVYKFLREGGNPQEPYDD